MDVKLITKVLDVESIIIDIIKNITGDSSISREIKIFEHKEINSMMFVKILVAIEESFEIELPLEVLEIDKYGDLSSVIDMICDLRNIR